MSHIRQLKHKVFGEDTKALFDLLRDRYYPFELHVKTIKDDSSRNYLYSNCKDSLNRREMLLLDGNYAYWFVSYESLVVIKATQV